MIKESKVVSVVTEIKSEIRKELQRKNYEDVLGLISICAKLLYSTNICYRDDFLEASLKEVSDAIDSYSYTLQDIESAEKDVVMFYDGFGLNERGLAQIYIKALCKFKKVIYVTFEDRKTLIPDIQNILNNHDAKSIYLNRRKLSNIALVEELSKVISEYSPKSFVYYSVPEDVIATTVLYAFEGKIRRYQINLTDHAFWLGAGCIDYCIEFRNYGASISNEYRCIEREKIVVIPFYPIVDRTRKFDGFPFALNEGQKVIFSGGALYKTLGDGNKYYEIVRRLLESNKDLVFWYAGNGKDTELRKILCDYPCRAFHTNERADLLQIMENSCFYLSTYPLSGGLMFQYAASGGCVPLTLRSPYMPTEFLCNQNSLDLEFDSIEDLILEAQKLLSDDKYAIMRGEQVKKAVMSQEEFESNVMNLIDDRIDSLQAPSFDHQDTKKFRDWYLDDMTVNDINALLVKKKDWRLGISHYPLRFIKGGYAYCTEDYYDATVIVATYNPSFKKITYTLDSIIRQKGIRFSIVISDDGSIENYFEQIDKYMSENSFSDYELISHKTNQGTVKNIYDAVQKARGRYLKLISPGDALIGENALADWIYKMKLSGSAWSFCDAVYYNSCPKRFYRKRYFAHPQLVNVYKTTMQSKCRWNYVILDDIALGAATIITKELLMEYLERIVGRVIYAEDNVFRIMMYEGEIPYYYSRTCLKYEFGEGISTSENDSWKQKLRADWNATDDIMLNDEMNIDLLQKKIRAALAWKNNNDSKKIWTIKKFFLKGKLMCVIRKKLNPRLVKVE